MNLARWLLSLMMLAWLTEARGQSGQAEFERIAERWIEDSFTAALVLTDSNSLSFGVLDFDPNEFVEVGDLAGNQDTLAFRQTVQTYALPWTFDFSSEQADGNKRLVLRGTYLKIKQDVDLWGDLNIEMDRYREEVVGASSHFWFSEPLSETWRYEFGVGVYLSHLTNNYQYNSAQSKALAFALDGTFFNLGATALLFAPNAKVSFNKQLTGFNYRLDSHLEAFGGVTVHGPSAKPHGWKWINGVTVAKPFAIGAAPLRWLTTAKRIELSNELERSLDTNHYYEFGTGLVFEFMEESSLFSNLGVGLSLNIGSALSGGSIVFLTNVE